MKHDMSYEEIHKSIINETISCEDASILMQTKKVRDDIDFFLDKENDKFSTKELETLKNIIYVAYDIYNYSGLETGISDTEYDILIEKYQNNTGKHIFSLELKKSEKEEYHKYPVLRGTLEKIYYLGNIDENEKVNKSRKGLDHWIQSCKNIIKEKTGRNVNMDDVEVYCFPKWDGVSAILEFEGTGKIERALTRGFTELNTAENITRHFRNIERVYKNKPYGLKTEIVVTEDDLSEFNSKYNKDYKQTRSIVSAILNSNEPDERNDYLKIIPLRLIEEGDENEIEELCDEVFDYPVLRCRLKDISMMEEFAYKHKYVSGIRCDGMVIRIIDESLQKILGRKDDKNKFEVAFKFTEEYAYTKIIDIDFQIGLFGRMTPVAKIKPVKLKGNTITNISLGSVDNFDRLQLSKGDTVKVLYDIIPYLTVDGKCDRSHKNHFEAPKKCPDCGNKLTREGAILFCDNDTCPSRTKGKILNYLVKMNIDGISFATISKLYDLGFVRDILDLYKLKKHYDKLINISGFGDISVDKMIEAIDSRKDVNSDTLLGSIGIEGIAHKTFSKILSTYTLDDLLDISKENDWESLVFVEGIGEKKAKKIIIGIESNRHLIKSLRKELNVTHKNKTIPNFSVCFTKVRNEELEKFIESIGGEIVDNVGKSTDILVVPKYGIQSSKVSKAEKYNIPIIPIDDVESYINNYFIKKKIDIIS